MSGEIVLSHSTESIFTGTLLYLTNLEYRKQFCIKGLCHDFPSKAFGLSVQKNFRIGTVLCFRKLLVSRNVKDKRERHDDFPSKLFCFTVPKHFVEENFCVSKSFGY